MTARHAHLSGGCQCGAVRYALYGEPDLVGICHCRMCQKATGSVMAPFATVAMDDFAWTRGTPAFFCSSDRAQRGFCSQCGTPLTYSALDTGRIDIMLGSLDNPQRLVPTVAHGHEGRIAWFGQLADLPARTTEDLFAQEGALPVISNQHPDHDTQD